MSSNFENSPSSPNLKAISRLFRLVGWIGFWVQAILTIISTVIFLFGTSLSMIPRNITPGNPSATGVNPGTGGGIFFSICSLFLLLYGIYHSFQCVRIGRQLQMGDRPRKADTVKQLWLSIMIRFFGLLLAILAAQAITGVLFGKSLQEFGNVFNPLGISRVVQPLDIVLVLANTHVITAHFVGLAGSMLLLSRVDR